MDLAVSLALVVVAMSVGAAYVVRVAVLGRAEHPRVVADGGSALVGKGVLQLLYWSIVPVAGAVARAGISADAVTWASLAFGVAGGLAFGAGHFGIGALLGLISSAGDAIDGLVARATGTASTRGEILDAAVDRYVDFVLLAGVAVANRGSAPMLLLTLAAIAGSFMVSYSTAKAEASGVDVPRGAMRRSERGVVLIVGACLTPIVAAWRPPWAGAPMAVAVGMIAVLGNLSVMNRIAALRTAAAKAAP